MEKSFQGEQSVEGMMYQLAQEVHVDFISISFREKPRNEYRWQFIYGSRSARVASMIFRVGQGTGGMTLQIGRMTHWKINTPAMHRLAQNCPVVQAEQLQTVVGIPLYSQGNMRGVLLMGRRIPASMKQWEIERAEHIIKQIAPYLEE